MEHEFDKAVILLMAGDAARGDHIDNHLLGDNFRESHVREEVILVCCRQLPLEYSFTEFFDICSHGGYHEVPVCLPVCPSVMCEKGGKKRGNWEPRSGASNFHIGLM